jgi:hypothetical protein
MKGAYYPCYVRPSVRMSQRGSHWTDLILGSLTKFCSEIPNFVKIGQSSGHFTYRPAVGFIVDADINPLNTELNPI